MNDKMPDVIYANSLGDWFYDYDRHRNKYIRSDLYDRRVTELLEANNRLVEENRKLKADGHLYDCDGCATTTEPVGDVKAALDDCLTCVRHGYIEFYVPFLWIFRKKKTYICPDCGGKGWL